MKLEKHLEMDVQWLKNASKFLDTYEAENPLQALAKQIAARLVNKGHLERDVKRWTTKNNLNTEQHLIIKNEVKQLLENRR